MLGDDAIPACGWCEDGITLWFDWLAMDAYDNRNWGPALEHVVFASMVISQLQQLSNPTRRAFYIPRVARGRAPLYNYYSTCASLSLCMLLD